jgi:hypothetical protein
MAQIFAAAVILRAAQNFLPSPAYREKDIAAAGNQSHEPAPKYRDRGIPLQGSAVADTTANIPAAARLRPPAPPAPLTRHNAPEAVNTRSMYAVNAATDKTF